MTGLDLAVVALIVLGAAWGAWKGALHLLGHLLASAAAIAVPSYLAGDVARALQGPLESSYPVAYLFAAGALALVSYVLVRLAFWFVGRRFLKKEGEEKESVVAIGNRLLGAFVGAAQLGLILWALLSVATLVAAPLEARGLKLRLTDSALYRFTKEHNLVAALFGDRLAALRSTLAADGTKKRGGKAVAKLQADKRFQALARDPALRRALAAGDVAALLQSPRLLELVSDRDAMDTALEAVAEQRAELERTAK